LTSLVGFILGLFINPDFYSSFSKIIFALIVIIVSYSLLNGLFLIIIFFMKLIPKINFYLFIITEIILYYILQILGRKVSFF